MLDRLDRWLWRFDWRCRLHLWLYRRRHADELAELKRQRLDA